MHKLQNVLHKNKKVVDIYVKSGMITKDRGIGLKSNKCALNIDLSACQGQIGVV